MQSTESGQKDFLRRAIEEDLAAGRFDHVHTRFAPEPNAYLHLGHAFSMSITYDVAVEYGGKYNLRFDDTNPTTEKTEYVQSIKEDIRWLGYDFEEREFYASDYFDQLYEWARLLIQKGRAYVCDLSEEQVKEYRGTNVFDEKGNRITPPGKDSPYRNRAVEENLELFEGMRAGKFPAGSRTLRAKIDMSDDNLLMRDPIMYRILYSEHHRTGTKWCIYPTYDWAHGQSDSIEGITHSICAIEFRHHRPLYDWFLEQLDVFHPRQIEYPRMNVTHTVMSKRYLARLMEEGHVRGWDDPRLPTLRGMRRRGYPPEAIHDFCRRIPISDDTPVSTVEFHFLEHCVREQLNRTAPRALAVLEPLKLVITNYPDDHEEELTAVNNPEDESAGTRPLPFCRELYIEREDFKEEPPPKYYRLAPGREVRLRYAYFVRCQQVVKDAKGNVVELRCSYDPATRGGDSPDGRKVKATLHWVSARHAVEAEVRLYEHLFSKEDPMAVEEGGSWLSNVNPDSLRVLRGCLLEPTLAGKPPGYRCQFERHGYFCVDPDSTPDRPVFNRIVSLKDTWKRLQARQAAGGGQAEVEGA
jgi:glutaminyl-tRNA synthetase